MIARLGWVLWLLLLYVLCLLSGAGLLQAVFALFLPLALLSLLLSAWASRQFRLSAGAETVGQKNEEITIPLVAENPSPLPLFGVACLLEGENRLTGEHFRQSVRFFVPARGRRHLSAAFSSRYCGRIEITVKSLRFYDWFGLFFFPKKCGESAAVTVLPEPFDLQLLANLARSCPEDSDEYSTRSPGNDPSEIFQVREYRPGDSLRQIHWKLTKKFDRLMTREASLPVDRSVLVVFDTVRPKGHAASPACYDAAADVLVSLSAALLENGISHTVAWRNAADGGVSSVSVASAEDLTEALPALLEGGSDDGIATLAAYCTEKSTNGISQILEICCAVPALPDASVTAETAVLCAADGEEAVDGVRYFHTDTYRDELSSLLL